MKKCNCKDWKENQRIIDSALGLQMSHGFGNGLKKSFNYCPYCGKKLVEIKNGRRNKD